MLVSTAMIRSAAARACTVVSAGWGPTPDSVHLGLTLRCSPWGRPLGCLFATSPSTGHVGVVGVPLSAGSPPVDKKLPPTGTFWTAPLQALRSPGTGMACWYSKVAKCADIDRALHHRAAPPAEPVTHATTILCVRAGGEVVVIGDGQATQNDFIVKPNVRKVRRLGAGTIAGFAGRAADGLTLLERLEAKLEEHPGQLRRAAVELAKLWRQDKMLRELDAALLVADREALLYLVGNGDVIEADSGIMAIGSGGDFAEAAAQALLQYQKDRQHTTTTPAGVCTSSACSDELTSGSPGADAAAGERPAVTASGAGSGPGTSDASPTSVLGPVQLDALGVALKAMHIAADCCVYTNHHFTWHIIRADGTMQQGSSSSS